MTLTQLLIATTLLATTNWADAADMTCLPRVSVPVMVRIGEAAPVAAVLEGGLEAPLSLLEAASRRLLWSAGRESATQVFPDMDAPITGSIIAIDLDGDGLHDRIYAGDMAARLWRFDLHHGAAVAHWATGGMFADFSNTEGRGFLAAADVSLSAPAGAAPWLNIAIGTAAPGNAAASNRFYALRDHAVHEAWTSEDYDDWKPLREQDLLQVAPTVQNIADATTPDPTGPGWYVELGSGHIVTPTITVDDRAVLAIATAVPRGGASCEVFARIATFELEQGRIVPAAAPGEWRTSLAAPIPVTAVFTMGAVERGIAPCTLAGQRIAACDVDTRPRKTWWRRMDAE